MKYIIKLVALSCLIILAFTSAFTKEPVEINLNIKNDLGQTSSYNFSFGIHPLASDIIDSELGELILPPPFMGFYAAFEFIDSTQLENDGSKYYDRIWTNKDLRHYPDTLEQYYVQHKLIFRFGQGKKIQINWNKDIIPNIIDSIFIKDRLNGFVVNHNMKQVSSMEWDNDEIRELFIHVYYNLKPTSYIENDISEYRVFPNPTSGIINIDNVELYNKIEIVDGYGNILPVTINSNVIDISKYSSGFYILRLYNNQGVISHKIVKN